MICSDFVPTYSLMNWCANKLFYFHLCLVRRSQYIVIVDFANRTQSFGFKYLFWGNSYALMDMLRKCVSTDDEIHTMRTFRMETRLKLTFINITYIDVDSALGVLTPYGCG
jgi:hypothetical protein